VIWAVTGWAVATWLKVTALLGGVVLVVWLVYGADSGWFWIAVGGGAVLELWTVRQLGREWASEARTSWWWAR
jgi:hypothetical protein